MKAFFSSLTGLLCCTFAVAQTAVTLDIGDDFQAAIDANPGNTTFTIAAGLHRLVQVRPREGNTFAGEDGAVLNGSRVLTGWTEEGGLWSHGGQTQEGETIGVSDYSCVEGELCRHPEDIYIDGEFLKQVGSVSDVVPGTFYFDYDN
ncbi:MAG: hypothetical protein GF418_08055, partial [Chitinivibrionales bacterium]|nr:hypothetical protein [Chitinivibrionales bacterium]MBD3395566.1 hypothetical protein [Chitinivibrionales bacterium]